MSNRPWDRPIGDYRIDPPRARVVTRATGDFAWMPDYEQSALAPEYEMRVTFDFSDWPTLVWVECEECSLGEMSQLGKDWIARIFNRCYWQNDSVRKGGLKFKQEVQDGTEPDDGWNY